MSCLFGKGSVSGELSQMFQHLFQSNKGHLGSRYIHMSFVHVCFPRFCQRGYGQK